MRRRSDPKSPNLYGHDMVGENGEAMNLHEIIRERFLEDSDLFDPELFSQREQEIRDDYDAFRELMSDF